VSASPVPVIRNNLIKATREWLEKNRQQLDKWVPIIERGLKWLERRPATAVNVASYALWLWQLLAQLGVATDSVTPEDGIQITDYRGFDQSTTDNLVLAANSALRLLSIPYVYLQAMGWEP